MTSLQPVQPRGRVLAVGQLDQCQILMLPKMQCKDRLNNNNNNKCNSLCSNNSKCSSRRHLLHMAGHSLSNNINRCKITQLLLRIIRILVMAMVAMAIMCRGQKKEKSRVMILPQLGTSR